MLVVRLRRCVRRQQQQGQQGQLYRDQHMGCSCSDGSSGSVRIACPPITEANLTVQSVLRSSHVHVPQGCVPQQGAASLVSGSYIPASAPCF